MLSPRWHKVLRDLWLHKARTLLVVLAIAVGIVGAGSALDSWALLRTVTREGYAATNPASAILGVDTVDAALLGRVMAVPGVADAEARRTVIGRALVQGVWRTAVLFSAGNLSEIRIGTVRPTSGVWPPPDGSIAIEASSVEYAGAVVGEAIPLQIGETPQAALPISGTARDEGLAPGWMEHVVYGFVTPGTLARLGAPASFNQLVFTVRDRSLDWEGVRRVASEVRAVVAGSGRQVTNVEVPEPGRHIHAGQIDSLLFTKGAFGVLALLLSGFLVINLISGMLAGQVREIGIMKALGARSGQVAGMYLGLALLLGLLACVVALPAAAGIGRRYAVFIAEVLNFDSSGFSIPAWAVALQVVVGALFPLAAAAIPVSRGCRIGVSEALRDLGLGNGSRAPGTTLSRVGGVGRPLLLSLRNAFRRRQRLALTLSALSLGGAVYLGALNLRGSIQDSVSNLYGGIMRQDMSLRFAEPHSADSLERAVRSSAGVDAAEGWTAARAAVERTDGSLGNGFTITGVPPSTTLIALPMEQGRWLASAGGNELVVTRRMLTEEPSLRLGGQITLIIAGRPTTWTLVGISNGGAFAAAYAQRDAVAQASGGGVQTVLVRAVSRKAADQAALSRRLRGEMAERGLVVASGELMAESRQVMDDHLLLVAQSLLVMAQLMIVVGGLGLASTMSLSVLERTREIGVMRAIGARHSAIHAMVQVEGLVIAVASWLLAIPLSIPISVVVGRAFGRIMLPVPDRFVPGASGVLLWLGVVLVVSAVACAWPAIRATRVPTAAALAYE